MPKKIFDNNGKIVAELIKEEDITSSLTGKTLAIIGYASQGRAQALNHKDINTKIIVGLRKNGISWKNALKDGWIKNENLFEIRDAVKKADIIHLLIADVEQPKVYKESIEPYLKENDTLVFSHGFNIHFKTIIPPKNIDVIMVAPGGAGKAVREEFLKNSGIPAVIAIYQDYTKKAKDTALAIAKAIGSARVGLLETTFKEETECDLFGEQVMVCGGIIELARKSYETMIEAGFNPIISYWEIHNQLYNSIAPLLLKKGNVGMLKNVSITAMHGALLSGPLVIDLNVKNNMKKVLERISNGDYAKELIKDYRKEGRRLVNNSLNEMEKSLFEVVGKQLRKIMWPNDKEVE